MCEIGCNLNYRQVCLDDGVHFSRLRQISSKYMPCDDDFVNAQLGHSDPIVKQWAIAAAGRVKNQKDVSTKIFNILNEDRYYDVRIYALSYLINSKQIVSIDITKELLSQAVTAKQKSILYNAIAVSSPTIESLIHLDVLIKNEPDAETRSVILTNELKIVKSGLVNSLIDKNELRAQFPELYKKSSEGRIEQEIFEMQRKSQQPELFEKELNSVVFSETPEKSMAEIEEQN